MINKDNLKKYCKDDVSKIENYETATMSNDLYDCHHRLETHNSDGERRLVNLSRTELIALDMYYNRPAEELILLSHPEHTILHLPRLYTGKPKKPGRGSDWHKGIPNSTETRRKISEALKGKMIGIKSPRAQPIMIVETGECFGSKREACRKYGKHIFDKERASKNVRTARYFTSKPISPQEYFEYLGEENNA